MTDASDEMAGQLARSIRPPDFASERAIRMFARELRKLRAERDAARLYSEELEEALQRIKDGREVRQPDGSTEVVDLDDAAEIAEAALVQRAGKAATTDRDRYVASLESIAKCPECGMSLLSDHDADCPYGGVKPGELWTMAKRVKSLEAALIEVRQDADRLANALDDMTDARHAPTDAYPGKAARARAALDHHLKTKAIQVVRAEDKTLSEVSASTSAPEAKGDGWLPIETAPRDETWILACRAGSKIPHVTTWDEVEKEWATFNMALERAMKRPWEPTHWMPLPPPPQASTEEECHE
jgi:hypothetical protein